MKKSYKKMFLFQMFLLLSLFLKSFIPNILSNYFLVIVLFVFLFIFKRIFGFEKDRHRLTKKMIYEIFVFLVIFFMIYYLVGIIIGFAKSGNYYSFRGLFVFILPVILTILFKEFLRYQMLKKSEGNKILLIQTYLLFVFLDIFIPLYFADYSSAFSIFSLIAMSILPAITKNIFTTYLSIQTGYKPVLFYVLIIELYQYILPIVPNPNEYLYSIIMFLLPIILLYKIYKIIEKEKDQFVLRDYKNKKRWTLIFPVCLILILVYFTSGYFRYQALAIASGSMLTAINKGDVVIIDKLKGDYTSIQKGDILAYFYDNVIVVHRIKNIINYGTERIYYTQGDANNDLDNYPITEDMIMGKVKYVIPYIGIPTVLINEL